MPQTLMKVSNRNIKAEYITDLFGVHGSLHIKSKGKIFIDKEIGYGPGCTIEAHLAYLKDFISTTEQQ
ncbi:MAG: hypothetical protein KGJ07_09990 [Patescibacteria group bacterium]|nr:hypothetical protein [Patescibacteria group bacterium]